MIPASIINIDINIASEKEGKRLLFGIPVYYYLLTTSYPGRMTDYLLCLDTNQRYNDIYTRARAHTHTHIGRYMNEISLMNIATYLRHPAPSTYMPMCIVLYI